MKIDIAENENKPLKYPFIVLYGNEKIPLLVTGPGASHNSYYGIVITGNSEYAPFQYNSDGWPKRTCSPFHGTITITQE